ncbi:hypothetical protein [Flagellimonas sp. 2504JD1-5]
MIRALKTYFEKGNIFHAVEIYGANDAIEFQFLEGRVKRRELIISRQCPLASISELQQLAHPSIPLYVAYNVDGVITKISQQNSTLKGRAAVEQLFPGLNFENFYYQVSQLKGYQVVSIAKRDAVETLLAQLKEKKLHVAGMSIGISGMEFIVDHLDDEIIYTNTEKVAFDNGPNEGLAITKSDTHTPVGYDINGLNIKSPFLLAFSGILDFLTPSHYGNTNFDDTVQSLLSEFKNQRIFGLLLRTSLVVVLVLLLSNFLVFNSYFGKVEAAKESLAIDNEARKNLTIVRDRVEEKERKVEAVLSAGNTRTSFYLDRLASGVPPTILLTELQYQPLIKPMQASKPIELDLNTLLVTGNCKQSEDFSEWIHHLEGLDWIKSVETMDYDYKNSYSSTFKIKIYVERT